MKRFSELSEEIAIYDLACEIEEGNITEEELQDLQEAIPLALIGAGKLIGAGLSAYSAYSAAKNLRKGKYGKAALDAVGMIPGGKVFKGMRALGAGKKLAKVGSAAQSATRWNLTGKTPNAYSRGVDTLWNAAGHALKGRNPFNKKLYQKKNTTKPAEIKPTTKTTVPTTTKPATGPKSFSFKGGLGYKPQKKTKPVGQIGQVQKLNKVG